MNSLADVGGGFGLVDRGAELYVEFRLAERSTGDVARAV